jgi:hypothetical protein
MGSRERLKQAKDNLSGFLMPDKERIERLQQILQQEQQREVTYEEAREVGEGLVNLYRALAGDRKINGVNPEVKGGYKV